MSSFNIIIIFSNYERIGPSGVRALPLAAGRNEGGHYFRYFGPEDNPNQPEDNPDHFHATVVKIPEGVVVGIQIFAWAPN